MAIQMALKEEHKDQNQLDLSPRQDKDKNEGSDLSPDDSEDTILKVLGLYEEEPA